MTCACGAGPSPPAAGGRALPSPPPRQGRGPAPPPPTPRGGSLSRSYRRNRASPSFGGGKKYLFIFGNEIFTIASIFQEKKCMKKYWDIKIVQKKKLK